MDAQTLKTLVRASVHGDEDARAAITAETGLVWNETFHKFMTPQTNALFGH